MKCFYRSCPECLWEAKVELPIGRRARRRHAKYVEQFEKGLWGSHKPKKLIPQIDICKHCWGTGLVQSRKFPEKDTKNYPSIAIIGGGIGGVALAIACLHRGIPYTLYERDTSFDERAQWYWLTLQQASKAITWLGLDDIKEGIISTIHLVHDTEGKVIGRWGRWKLSKEELTKTTKPRNIHISRQSLRAQLISQLGEGTDIAWGHRLKNISHNDVWKIDLEFETGQKSHRITADLVVGADGIRSTVRRHLIGEEKSPLQYLGCIVILGICRLESLSDVQSHLLDSKTVFQTVNGTERIYMMPYDAENIMWQLSFPLDEEEAKKLSKQWANTLKQEAIQRLWNWHSPIPEILKATDIWKISGYPVYDREILDHESLANIWNITLIWDAMHPMSPFKWQGANQAILDALDLARAITANCLLDSNWKETWLRKTLLEDFEKKMLARSVLKVRDSARAVKLLHSDAVLHDWDSPRGRGI